MIPDDAYPYTFPSGLKFEKLSHHRALDLLLKTMDYRKLREEQKELRSRSVFRGIGLAAMIEVTNPSPAFYGVGGARISAQDGATLRFEPDRKSTRLNSSHLVISYAVFCLKKKIKVRGSNISQMKVDNDVGEEVLSVGLEERTT